MGGVCAGLMGRNEPIAAACQRLNERWGISRIAKRPPDLLDRGVEPVFEIDEGVGFPEPFAQFLPGDDLARAFEQCREYLSRLFLQPHAFALAVELAGRRRRTQTIRTGGAGVPCGPCAAGWDGECRCRGDASSNSVMPVSGRPVHPKFTHSPHAVHRFCAAIAVLSTLASIHVQRIRRQLESTISEEGRP